MSLCNPPPLPRFLRTGQSVVHLDGLVLGSRRNSFREVACCTAKPRRFRQKYTGRRVLRVARELSH